LADTDTEQQPEQRPRGHQLEDGQDAERRRNQQHVRLCDDQKTSPVDKVANCPGKDGEKEDRHARSALHQSHVCRGAGERKHEPLRPDGLHPAADVADKGRSGHCREHRVMERRPR
jgi:hypothetical protein